MTPRASVAAAPGAAPVLPASVAGATPAQSLGGFRLGGLHCALPMAALREVVPCRSLLPLPCDTACVVGGLDLRGVLLPVLDLRLLLGRPAPPLDDPCAIVMVHDGHILGLLCDGVSGIFAGPPPGASRLRDDGPDGALFSHGLRAANGSMVNLLSPAALSRLPGVPMVSDPQPQRAQPVEIDDAGPVVAREAGSVPMLLLSSGRMSLAVAAVEVQATLSDPVVRPSVLAQGACRGVLTHAGQDVPALDLLEVCGLGRGEPQGLHQAFVMQVGRGRVAFLVRAVVDIVEVRAADRMALPAFALKRPGLFDGTLQLPVRAGRPADGPSAPMPHLVLHAPALRALDEVAGLASMHDDGEPAATAGCPPGVAGEAAAAASLEVHTMLTYELAVETATPLEQVSEILPFDPSIVVFEPDGPVLGVLLSRGRSIPVLCLNQLTCGRRAQGRTASGVLVVESEGEWVGFAVPALRGIEPAHWQPELGTTGAQAAGAADLDGSGRGRLALVGRGRTERMLPVVDLRRMARSLQQRVPVH